MYLYVTKLNMRHWDKIANAITSSLFCVVGFIIWLLRKAADQGVQNFGAVIPCEEEITALSSKHSPPPPPHAADLVPFRRTERHIVTQARSQAGGGGGGGGGGTCVWGVPTP